MTKSRNRILGEGGWVELDPIVTTSGTEHGWSGLPAWMSEFELTLEGVSLSGNDDLLVQLGGAIFATSGYNGIAAIITEAGVADSIKDTTAFFLRSSGDAYSWSGPMRIVLGHKADRRWTARFNGLHELSTDRWAAYGGILVMPDDVTRIRVTRNGTNTFDAGTIRGRYR